MLSLPPITLRLRGWKLMDRVALAFLLLCAIAAWRNVLHHRITAGASTITMQLAGNLFLDRSDRSFRRKMQEMLLALQIERRYTKPQIFTMYANQVYLAHGNYGF